MAVAEFLSMQLRISRLETIKSEEIFGELRFFQTELWIWELKRTEAIIFLKTMQTQETPLHFSTIQQTKSTLSEIAGEKTNFLQMQW